MGGRNRRHGSWKGLLWCLGILRGLTVGVVARSWRDIFFLRESLQDETEESSLIRKRDRHHHRDRPDENVLYDDPSPTTPHYPKDDFPAMAPFILPTEDLAEPIPIQKHTHRNDSHRHRHRNDNIFIHSSSDITGATTRTVRKASPPTDTKTTRKNVEPITNPPYMPPKASPAKISNTTNLEDYPPASIPLNPPRSYFNYDTSLDSNYGPGYPVYSYGSHELVLEYANNAWAHASSSEEWDEFGPKGFGPWKGLLDTEKNQCASHHNRQSPIDLRPTGVACLEHHQIRTRSGDFKLTSRNVRFQILPSKLRVWFQRRPCAQFDHPVCSEPDPPHADFPHGWPGFADVLHVDFKFPGEHTLEGKHYDGEMQIVHLHPRRKRLVTVSVLMEAGDTTNDYLQEAIDAFAEEYDRHQHRCESSQRRLSSGRGLSSSRWDPHHLVPTYYFYGYDGSLTEPPCSEIVSWFVMDRPMKLSKDQLQTLQTILFTNKDPDTCETTAVHYRNSVARPIQDTNRPIWHCTPEHFAPDGNG